MASDARHQPAGPPPAGSNQKTPAVQAVVAGIKAQNAQTKADRKAARK